MLNNYNKTDFLLVEDDDADSYLFEFAFKNLSDRVLIKRVRDGVEAIEYLEGKGVYANRKEYPLPKVIILDLKTPRIDGFDFLRWLRRDCAGDLSIIPVVVLSSTNLALEVTKAYAFGANAYMQKPIDLVVFRKKIEAIGVYWAEYVEAPQISHAPQSSQMFQA